MVDSRRARFIKLLCAVIALAVFYFSTQFLTERIVGYDGHFHIRYSNLMLERGIPDRLPELKFTIWGQEYRDYHFLFHVLSIPFSLIPDIAVGAKAAAATFAVFAGIAFWLLLTGLRVRIPWAWLLLFMAGSSGLLFRIQMPRVQSLSLMMILLVIFAIAKRRYWMLSVVAFLNVWLYDSFILLVIVGVAWVVSQRVISHRWDLRAFAHIVGGLLAGTILNPFFPDNYASYLMTIRRSLAPMGSIPLTSEWYSEVGWRLLIDNAPIAIIAALLAFVSVGTPGRAEGEDDAPRVERLFLLILTIFFTVLLMRSRRFIEYAPAIAIAFMAVIHRDLWDRLTDARRWYLNATIIIFAVVCSLPVTWNFVQSTKTDERYECYRRAGEWLDKNAAREDVIFTTDWDDFPMLYMRAPYVQYVVGMDPLFLLWYDKDLYKTYRDITLGSRDGPYAPVIMDRFESKYVFSDSEHGAFLEKFDKEPGVYRVFSEKECRIYRLKGD